MSNPSGKKFSAPRPDASRLLAFDILHEVNRNGGYSNLLLPKALAQSSLDERDRGFTTELVYGTLRMQGRHDWILGQASDRPWAEVDPALVDVARLGAHQLFEMRVPTHAAVSATVELGRKVLGESKASFLNAILRKISQKSLDDYVTDISNIKDDFERLEILHSHPQWIISAYMDQLGSIEEVEKLLIANNIAPRPTLVSWPGLSSQEDLVDLGATPTRYSPYGAVYDGSPASLDLVISRNAGVQDEGSQLVADVFAQVSRDQSSWLDLCAGPGGKAALLSAIAKSENIDFSANEISEVRAKLVRQVVHGASVTSIDAREIYSLGKTYGAILADVPCTGLGALRRRPEVRWRRTVADLKSLVVLQSEIIDSAIQVLEPGGIFGYATCSPHLSETRIAVSEALKRHPQMEAIDVSPYLHSDLKNSAVSRGNMTLWTHLHNTDAMFLSVMRKRK
ncbi:Sun tRNA and rRNA cytosine-C5-methylases [Candidatus Nanopelagicaceae bacterium]